ncbi:fungal-specific transcription factor domain-containing protein [Penicillium canariense]|uniref:Fungal-specific transcription factor domain-containing protein n=1 Tax=Penicillium canariense TaxID=189055 RepID=A0A9W9I6Z0_9EURO|nr:fungal-specific transcription factor domain-containing protein [Penicillium canariense]KAJ5167824.1 fungal-specific transcription factor domain-containing protein [Penicillium canariense]
MAGPSCSLRSGKRCMVRIGSRKERRSRKKIPGSCTAFVRVLVDLGGQMYRVPAEQDQVLGRRAVRQLPTTIAGLSVCRGKQQNPSFRKVCAICEAPFSFFMKQAYNWQRATGVKRPREDCFRFDEDLDPGHVVNDFGSAAELLDPRAGESPASPAANLSCTIWASPFTLPTTVIKDNHQEQRNWIWLAPSSAWSLTARLIVMMTEKLDVDSVREPPRFYLDGDIYPFAWNRVTNLDPIDTSGLPSRDYALHLFQIVRFHLGQAYRFFDHDSFVTRIRQFYNSRADEKVVQPRFWFVQFLMVLALGNAFLSRPRNQDYPPGSKYFARAMSAMPNYTCTGKDSLLAIEALALVGLYLYAIDHREAAHVHIGHAVRIAQLEGMHTQLPEEVLGAETVARCRNLWWSLYTMDRHFSPSLGLPMTTKDSEITTLISSSSSDPPDLAFSLQVRITRMLSFIICTIYKTEKTPLGTFLEITRSILETMARYAEEIEKMIHVSFQGSIDNVSEETRHTILLYHQCVIVATRPLLLSVLKERLEKLGRAEEDWQKFLALPISLISIGIKSAEKTLQIIGDENGLLETFLPFDLEMTYAAAIHLTMANALFPPETDVRPYSQAAHSILDEMILCGNRVAEARKRELIRIEGLFQELARRVEQEGLRILTLADQGLSEIVPLNIPDEPQSREVAMTESAMVLPSSARDNRPSSADTSAPANIEFLDSIGISSNEFLTIVDQINNPGMPYGALDVRPDWLTGDDPTTYSFG